MRHATILVAILAFVPLIDATAQVPVKVGERVRFWTTQSRIATYGTLTRWEADSLAIGDNWIPATSVVRIEVKRRHSRLVRIVEYTGRGLLVGALAGWLFFYLPCDPKDAYFGCPSTQWEPIEIGAVVGALAGALVGATRKRDYWVSVSLDQLLVGFVPQRGGRFGLGASVRF